MSSDTTTEQTPIAESNQPAESSQPAEQGQGQAEQEQAKQPEAPKVEYSISPGFGGLLKRLNSSVAFTSYQSGLLYMVGRNKDGGINIHQAAMPKPMGLNREADGGLILASGYQIMRFKNVLEPDQQINHTFDACYVPRTVHVTGYLDAHDVGIDRDGRPVFVNTRYNCLATVSERHSFEMVWKPPFITDLVDEDRCHLNGLALEDGVPRYVTAVSRSNTIDGWRDRRGDGGIVIDVQSNEIVCRGLSMPHSPRLHNGELWLFNSGSGELGVVNLEAENEDGSRGTFEPRVFCPGFLRGLSFHGNYAFVGLSKPRYKRFEGLALDQKLQNADSDPWCGVQVIDLTNNSCAEWLRIDGDVAELYDLELLPGVICPMAVPPMSEEAASLVTFAPLV